MIIFFPAAFGPSRHGSWGSLGAGGTVCLSSPDSIANFLKMQINRSHNINLGFPYFLCVWVLGLFFCLVGGFCLFVFSVGK